MQIKRTVIGLALATAVAGGFAAATAATNPDIYYDLSPAINHSTVTSTPVQSAATVTDSSAETPGIYYDL